MTITDKWRPRRLGILLAACLGIAGGCSKPDGQPTGGIGASPASMTRAQAVMAKPSDKITFDLHLNPKFTVCLLQCDSLPTAEVTVERGPLNDTLTIHGENFKPGMAFDLFTVQRSSLLNDGTVDPAFTNFGLAWYQSDLQADAQGEIDAKIQTILLDQIFGFDPDVALPPLNTFHVGFWFNDPQDAAPCGFDPTKPTPFNGAHAAGPLAMISVPDATTGLGPLCTNPDTSTSPPRCNP